jgi:hypothetical protein
MFNKANLNMLRKLRNILFAQLVLACLMPLTLSAENLLLNPGFNKPAAGVPPGTIVSLAVCQETGGSAAANWTVWINDCGSDVSTQLIPSAAPSGGSYMVHVVTTGNGNGIVQCCFANQTTTLSSVWVYVNSGCVGMGTGDGGNTVQTDEMTCEAGSWIQFKAPNGVSPASEFIVYSVGVVNNAGESTVGADYYVDNAKVVAGEKAEITGTGGQPTHSTCPTLSGHGPSGTAMPSPDEPPSPCITDPGK